MLDVMGPANVAIFGGLEPDGEVAERCRIHFFGESPHAQAKLYQEQGGRFVEIDQLSDATVVADGDGLVVVGVSAVLVAQVGLAPANAITKWRISGGSRG